MNKNCNKKKDNIGDQLCSMQCIVMRMMMCDYYYYYYYYYLCTTNTNMYGICVPTNNKRLCEESNVK